MHHTNFGDEFNFDQSEFSYPNFFLQNDLHDAGVALGSHAPDEQILTHSLKFFAT